MRLKAMLVDDELPILNNLKAVLPWDDMGIEVIALARNGQEAFDYYKEKQPDLILCDIRMPIMDGITFLTEIRKLSTECEVLMLTGYQEFEYARIALQNGVRDYILKPINYDVLETTVRKVSEDIRARKMKSIHTGERWRVMAQMAHEKILYNMLLGFSSEQTLYMHVDEDKPIEKFQYTIFLADTDHYAQLSLQWSEVDRKRWNSDVRQVLQTALVAENFLCSVLQLREGEWCILVRHESDEHEQVEGRAGVWLNSLQQSVREQIELPVSVAVYPSQIVVADLATSYKKLQFILLQASSSMVPELLDESADAHDRSQSLWNTIDDIVSGLRKLDQSIMHKALTGLKRIYLEESQRKQVSMDKFLHYLLIHLLREMREMNIVTSNEEEQIWKKLNHSISEKDVMEVIIQLVDAALTKAFCKKSSQKLMLSAKDYIHKRLARDIGVEELAGHLGISSSYFSLLFKSHFGETFVEYVTRQRMELAQSLLLTSDKTVTEIGVVTGYSERRYFTKVFQKYVRMTPSEFREINQAVRQ
ncbi:response regulator [Paenibacillus sp. GSMTC-2017]|uniref:response regulator transcription factor n=1 Tax=Paenibacillus sp. GSMTC-2017 TaxID=2794350 RepID=UPI0018D8F20F|nr:response regulator [Paenibacillus sp. GSMTC-2017]MBH5318872.1 response regulator [Paenibacillus sp. GSMTC-2017]